MMKDVKKLKNLAQRFTVLYVEDDLSIQNTMRRYLEKFFVKVDVANDGVDGFARYIDNNYDLVITDLSMPNMNGIDMLHQIRERSEEQSVLITSAYSDAEYLLDAIKLGIDGYIIKPFDYEQLNNELYKISNKLQKFKEATLYKTYLENSLHEKSAIVSSLVEFEHENYEKTLYSMVEMIEDRDTYTAGHSKRVATYSRMIAEAMGYSENECVKIYQAGMLHDIGKVATPDAVLLNPARLNDIEYNLIKEHVNVGYKLLSNVPMFSQLADIIYSHHERYDGNGYPRGISDEEITPLARIIIVADAFDAMTTSRIYKGKKTVKEAVSELEELSGIQFHPEVIDVAKGILKSVVIDESINQLPKTELEEKRFAYFYKDILTDTYNKNYLDLVLVKNSYEISYTYMDIYLLKDFTYFNKENSWASGDEFLKSFASLLKDSCKECIVFRIFGDDFVILSNNTTGFNSLKSKIDKITKDNGLRYIHKSIDLTKTDMTTIGDIENIIGLT